MFSSPCIAANRTRSARVCDDIFIHVTAFFRDPPVFEELKRLVFPAITAPKPPGTPIRVWIAGCATGEEVYSVAIALHEFFGENEPAWPVQIFGRHACRRDMKGAGGIARRRESRLVELQNLDESGLIGRRAILSREVSTGNCRKTPSSCTHRLTSERSRRGAPSGPLISSL